MFRKIDTQLYFKISIYFGDRKFHDLLDSNFP